MIGTILALLGRWNWLFELATHFRLQFFSILMFCGLVLAIAKHYFRSLAACVLAIVNLAVLAPWNHGPVVPLNAGTSLRAATLNVYHGNERYAEVIQFVREIDADLWMFTEVDADWAEALMALKSDFRFVRVLKTEPIMGVVVCSRYPLADVHVVPLGDTGYATLQATMEFNGQNLTIFGIHTYSPISGKLARLRNRQLASLAELAAAQTGPTMVLGDLNVSPFSPFFQDLLSVSGLHDSRAGFGYQGSWPAAVWPMRIPIDHCLVSSQIAVCNRQVRRCPGSDHLSVIVDIKLPEAATTSAAP